jgi:hypothetical protein
MDKSSTIKAGNAWGFLSKPKICIQNQNVCRSPLSDRNKNFESQSWHLDFKSVILVINGIGTGKI